MLYHSSFKKLISNTTWLKKRSERRGIKNENYITEKVITKMVTLDDYCSKNNNGMNSVKQHNDSLESNKDITDLNHNTNDVINENSIIRNETDLFDASAKGVGRLGISPLKGLSSSLKPRIYKSIGIQVGSENR